MRHAYAAAHDTPPMRRFDFFTLRTIRHAFAAASSSCLHAAAEKAATRHYAPFTPLLPPRRCAATPLRLSFIEI